jgi:hypothetical protein
MNSFTGTALPLSEQGFAGALDILGVGAPEVWTVLSVETRGFGFLPDRRPLILFERHIFSTETGGVFNANHPAISAPQPGGYAGGVAEYNRLQAAVALDRSAALHSASWGIGQVLGLNAKLAGFDTVEAMVDLMIQSEDAQLAGMANFVRSRGLHLALRSHDWARFARGYNGPGFAGNQYDTRLASSWQKFSNGPAPDLRVRRAQALLTFLGIDPAGVDGVPGKATQTAIAQFREQNRLGSGEIDDALLAALQQKVEKIAAAATA